MRGAAVSPSALLLVFVSDVFNCRMEQPLGASSTTADLMGFLRARVEKKELTLSEDELVSFEAFRMCGREFVKRTWKDVVETLAPCADGAALAMKMAFAIIAEALCKAINPPVAVMTGKRGEDVLPVVL